MTTQEKFQKEIWPVIGPFLLLATSRKGLIWLVGAALMLLFAYAPGAQVIEEQLSVVLLAVFGFVGSVLIAAIGYEDGQRNANESWPKLQPWDMTPIWSPIVSLLRSRKFLVWLSTLIVGFIVTNVPWLSDYNEQLLEIFIYVFGAVTTALLGATAYEDGKKKHPSLRYVYAVHPPGTVLGGWELNESETAGSGQPRQKPVVLKSVMVGTHEDARRAVANSPEHLGLHPRIDEDLKRTGTDG